LSNRFPGVPAHFHPNNHTPNQDPPYNDPIFFNDVSYFNNLDFTGPAPGYYHGAPTYGLGAAGDSLIAWARWLKDDIGIDEFRIDAIKHINPDFIAKFLMEIDPSTTSQPYAVGEFFDFNASTVANYQNQVESNGNAGTKLAELAMFDFTLRAQLKSVLDNTTGSTDIYQTLQAQGLVWGAGESGFDVVTWLDNHDKDRIGFEGAGVVDINGNCDPGEIKAGNSCLVITGGSSSDHDPIINDKGDMGYPFIMATEGRPTVFWKDWYWYGLADQIKWQMAMRASFANGFSEHIANLNGFWPNNGDFDGDNNGGNTFAMVRWGLSSGTQDGLVLALNDHPSKKGGVYVNSPFSNKHLKDYSDGFMFIQSQAFNDSRTLVQAESRDYGWWGLTGQYPHPPEVADPFFVMGASPGGAVHWVILDTDDLANFEVNGGALEVGDQIAIVNGANEVCGIGRVGQEFGWNSSQDMLIEVIGPFPTDADPVGGAANGMAVGENFSLVVFDASENDFVASSSITFANLGSSGTFNALRPASPNRSASFTQPSTTAQGTFAYNGVSRITAFVANTPATTFPVEWLGLEATVKESDVHLSWTVAQEVNNRGFEVEILSEKDAAKGYEVIGFVAGRGTAESAHTYTFDATSLEPGVYQFRLRQIDLDGAYAYSPQVNATIEAPAFGWQLSPNPVRENLYLDVQVYQTAPLSVRVFDAAGKLVLTQAWNELPSGSHRLELPLRAFPNGLYLVQVQQAGNMGSQRILKN